MRLLIVAVFLVMLAMAVSSARVIAPKHLNPSVQERLDRITDLMDKEAERKKSAPKDQDEKVKLLDLSKFPNALNYVKKRFGENNEKAINKIFRDRS